jgi:anthranilate phosphoribosyltransferase
MKDILNHLLKHHTLDQAQSKSTLRKIAEGAYNDSQVTAFMTIYMMRKITVDELMGFRDAMLEMCIPVDIAEYRAMDLCGTGGDGKDTFNISTLSSFVVAGAGQPVAKHGNNGVSSVCGSSNLLQHFGVEFTNDQGNLKRNLDEANICFLHAPLFHPAMKNVAPLRKQLGLKTFFNMLGPMVNPSFPKKQLVGVFNLELARLYAYLYQQSEVEYVILHALDGYDEISLTGDFKVISPNKELVLSPHDIGRAKVTQQELSGGTTIEESANVFEKILKGAGTVAQNDVVIANAGMALYAADSNLEMHEAMNRAEESLRSGAALKSFKALVNKRTQVSMN